MYWCSDASKTSLWYQDQGVGIPLVLIHGWCMSSDIWNLQVPELAKSFRIITVDLPGHGKSIPLEGGFSIKGCAEAIADLTVHLDLQCAVLAGWSLGSQVAVTMVNRIRKRLSGLVLIAATPRFTRTDEYPYGLSLAEAEGMALKVRRNSTRARDGFIANMFTQDELHNTLRTTQVQDLLASIPFPESAAALQALQALVDADLRDVLPRIALPTLLIHGDMDVICPPDVSDFMAGLIPRARRILFSACGHAPFLSQPQQFNACMKDFLEHVSENCE